MFRQRQIEMLKYILWLECFKRAPSTRRMCLPKRLSRVHCIWRDGKKSQFIYHESNNFLTSPLPLIHLCGELSVRPYHSEFVSCD
jgi:hypothetical protein